MSSGSRCRLTRLLMALAAPNACFHEVAWGSSSPSAVAKALA